MELENIEEVVRNITKIVLTNPQKMIREEDLKNLSKNFNFDTVMSDIYVKLKTPVEQVLGEYFFS